MISDLCDYKTFLNRKAHSSLDHGFEPIWMPDSLFDFQVALTNWAIRKGRAAIFADCGLGKTPMQLIWAENVLRQTNKPVLILTPLAVAFQTVKEGEKFGVDVAHRRTGIKQGDGVIVTNYERLHYFDSNDFGGIVCDESSILKNFDGSTRQAVTEFMREIPYRLLCTATAAPNDYTELGTSSEALGYMGMYDMLSKFFKRQKGFCRIGNMGGQGWEMRPYAQTDFWRWVCSWARACRRPSDLGFENRGFSLPDLNRIDHIVTARKKRCGHLFDIPAIGLSEQREDLRRTLGERCEMVASLVNNNGDNHAVCWTNLNAEADLIRKLIPDSVNIQGSDTDEKKEDAFRAFADGKIRVLISKPTIAGFGLNWQHCAHMTFFPSHSYEQYYQAVRRCWRFGQKRNVTVDMITTDGQQNVLENMNRKHDAADAMFSKLTKMMMNELSISKRNDAINTEEIPSWL